MMLFWLIQHLIPVEWFERLLEEMMIRLELCGLWTLMQQRTLVGELQRQRHPLMCKWHHYHDFDISISMSIFLETPSLPKKNIFAEIHV